MNSQLDTEPICNNSHPRRRGRPARLCLLSVALCLLPGAASARINVVTLPGRDTVQLTIYNSADLTLVKEKRLLTFRKGLNRLEFSWANTSIDPTSVEFRAATHGDEVELVDVSFPPRVTNTLEWRIQSEIAGEVQVEISYFTSGIGWAADYLAEANPPEKLMALAGYVRVNNNSGEDYENAQVRLVVGVIRLVEEIAQLAKIGRPGPLPGPVPSAAPAVAGVTLARRAMKAAVAEAEAAPREIVKEGVSEYFLYTVEGRDTIPTGWSKRLPSFRAEEVPIVSYYKYEKEQWADRVIRFYRFKNDSKSKLGNEPLPDGQVQAFRVVGDDRLYSYVGRTGVKYIPIGEEVEMELGEDREVMVKPRLLSWAKEEIKFDQNGNVAGWTIKEQWELELQNSKAIAVVVDARRNFAGDWTLATQAAYERVDAQKVKFVVPLAPGEKQKLRYETTTRHGTNVSK